MSLATEGLDRFCEFDRCVWLRGDSFKDPR